MISMDKKYQTRGGQTARVLCNDRKRAPPVIYLANDSEINCCDRHGASNMRPEYDLIEIKPPVVFWVNSLTYDCGASAFDTKDAALAAVAGCEKSYDIIARRVELPIEEQE